MKGLLIANGNNILDSKILEELVDNTEYIVAVDGGIKYLIDINKIPNVLIGDLDSINKKDLEFLNRKNIRKIQYPEMQDSTDTELAVDFMIGKGIKDITLIGVTGSRIDHTISNILLLKRLKDKNIKGKIIDNNNTIYYVDDIIKIRKLDNMNISIIPLSLTGIVVDLEGFLYSVTEEKIEFGSTLAVSNKLIDEYGVIEIKRGESLVIESKD